MIDPQWYDGEPFLQRYECRCAKSVQVLDMKGRARKHSGVHRDAIRVFHADCNRFDDSTGVL
jgi:hypothetical protein